MQTLEKTNRISIPVEAFDFNLDPYEFRVYCCLVRLADESNQISESIEKMAEACNIDRKTVRRVLNLFVQMGMIRRLATTKGYVHCLTDSQDWVQQPKRIDPSDGSIPQTDRSVGQQDSTPPLKGGVESVVDEEQSAKRIDVPQTDTSNLDDKLSAVRDLGCKAGIRWQGQEIQVVVDGWFLSVQEFMQRSLSSFDHAKQVCAEGLAKCREQIERLKRRKAESVWEEAN